MIQTPLTLLHTKPFQLGVLCITTAAYLAACGGGGTSGITLSGTAATGAPMAGATVIVKDSSGTNVCENSCFVNQNGSFAAGLKVNAKGPFVLQITEEGSGEPQVSMIDTAQSTTVNVSPITTLIAARLSPSGDPTQLTSADLSSTKIEAASNEIKTALQPLLTAANLSMDGM